MLVVVKIGTDSVIGNIPKIVNDVVKLKKTGCDVIIVSSGAVGTGRKILPNMGKTLPEKQILASVGQVHLIQQYQTEFAKYGMSVGQILITKKDIENKEERENIENLTFAMLKIGKIIPIFNENDSIVLQSLMFTDNDEIAGMLASQFGADRLIILTNVDGVFDDFTSENRKILHEVYPDDTLEISNVTSTGGRGGMYSKVNTAKKLADLGISTTICNVMEKDVLIRALGCCVVADKPKIVEEKKCEVIDKNKQTYTDLFAQTLIYLSENDDKIVGITAGMPGGTGMDKFAKIFPERMFDVAIAEQHAVTFAGGLAVSGYKPFCALYSTFLQRAYDQIIHDIAIQSLPVRFAIDRAGFVGADGATHAGLFDISSLISIPNMIIMAASCGQDLVGMIKLMYEINDKPSCVRYPRGEILESTLSNDIADIKSMQLGKMREIYNHNSKICILSFGSILKNVLQAYDILKSEHNIKVSIFDARFAKPLDCVKISELVNSGVEKIITIEEGLMCGFGAVVNEYIAKNHSSCNVFQMHIEDCFIDHGSIENLYKFAKIDADSIVKNIRNIL